jgi:zinc transport system substrate-binding protein
MMRHNILAALAVALSPITAAADVVYTVNWPLFSFANAIADDRVEVVFPAPLDVDPAYWTPDADTLLAYQRADLVLLNGAGYAKWVEDAGLPRSRLVDTTQDVRDRLIELESGPVHSHGPDGAHSHGAGFAFTTWLDPEIARAQAQATYDAMARRWPEHAETFAAGHAVLDRQLAEIDAELHATFAPLRGRRVLASHPVYQYLGRAVDLDLLSFHWEPDTTPGQEEWARMDAALEERNATIMLWEDSPTPETIELLDERNVKVVVLPPLGNRPTHADISMPDVLRNYVDGISSN